MNLDLIERIAAANRTKVLIACLLLAALITLGERFIVRAVSLSILYVLPLTISAVFLSRWQIFLAAAAATILAEQFGATPWQGDIVARLSTGLMAFGGVGLLVAEIVRRRQVQAEGIKRLGEAGILRRKAEEDARALIESSPAAIITVDATGHIEMTNKAAKRLLALGPEPAAGQNIGDYFPVLGDLMRSKRVRSKREVALASTMVEGGGRRCNGEAFFAQMWLSSYQGESGAKLAVVVADVSEHLRDREELGLRQLLMNSRIIAAAVSHEIRNIAAAASALHSNIGQSSGIADNEDFKALGQLIQATRKLSSAEVPASGEQVLSGIDLRALLRELAIIVSPAAEDSNVKLVWEIGDDLPRVRVDHNGLLQVLLNLTQNSMRALGGNPCARITVAAYQVGDAVAVRFSDNGPGVVAPEVLFQPFQPGASSTGLGLYVSRAIVRTYGGELQYISRPHERGFLIDLPVAPLDASNDV
jgi:two-component system, LuxR family, sensor kinase FixL